MAPPLLSLEDYETRLGRDLSAAEQGQVTALLDDVSAEIRDVAGEDFLDEAEALEDVPPTIVAVTYRAVRRAAENPRGLSGETLGDYSWQGAGGSAAGVFLSAGERRAVRRAVGRSSVIALQLEGDLPLGVPFTRLDQLL